MGIFYHVFNSISKFKGSFILISGLIPLPVIFGSLIDSACLVWEKSCGETGNCWFYDTDKYRHLLHGMAALSCSLSVMGTVLLYFLSPRIRNLYTEEVEDEQAKYVDIRVCTVSESGTTL